MHQYLTDVMAPAVYIGISFDDVYSIMLYCCSAQIYLHLLFYYDR